MSEGQKNEIVVYQPNETIRLEVRMQNDTVWLTQEQIADLFGTRRPAITKHLSNIFKSGEVDETTSCSILEHMGNDGVQRYRTKYYNLDAILSVGYRVNSRNATLFRRWANTVLREYLLRGIVIGRSKDALAMEMDRRFSAHETRLAAVERKIDFVVNQALPPPETVFVEGQFLDAHVELRKIVLSARHRIVLVDNFIDERVFTLLAERQAGVSCAIFGKNAGRQDVQLAYSRFRQQYPNDGLTLTQWNAAHDRFLIADDTLWHIGGSVKDAGCRIFALIRMALPPDVILDLLP